MGEFFTNFHAKTSDRVAVEDVLKTFGPYFISDSENDWVSFFPQASEEQDQAIIDEISAKVSAKIEGAVFSFLVHDGDVFQMTLAKSGILVDSYDSDPGYFDGKNRKPKGGELSVILPHCKAGIKESVLKRLLQKKKYKAKPLTAEEEKAYSEHLAREKNKMLDKYSRMAQCTPEELYDVMPDIKNMLWYLERDIRYVHQKSDEAGASDQAYAMAELLGIPEWRAGIGFEYIQSGDVGEIGTLTQFMPG